MRLLAVTDRSSNINGSNRVRNPVRFNAPKVIRSRWTSQGLKGKLPDKDLPFPAPVSALDEIMNGEERKNNPHFFKKSNNGTNSSSIIFKGRLKSTIPTLENHPI